MRVEPQSDPYSLNKKTDTTLFNLNSFYLERPPRFDLDIEPEFIATLNASVPTEEVCKKIRYKKVPVNAVRIDGDIARGENWVRYRGFCYLHWLGEQKSLKVSLDKKYRGYGTVNLNAFRTDPSLFDMWAGQLMTLTGGVASRVGLAEVYINGEFSGTRQIVENMDQDLAKNQSIPKGMFIRELTHASMGHTINKASRYENFTDIETKWKKNSRKSASWDDFLEFQQSIFDGVRRNSDDWKDHVDLDHYVNYLAVQIITGTQHQNNHNIPVLLPGKDSERKTGPIIPVGYDFGAPSAAIISRNIQSEDEVFGYSQNWLTDLLWASEVERKLVEQRIVEILLEYEPAELFTRVSDRTKSLMGKELSTEDLALIARTKSRIEDRVGFLKKRYLEPKAHITPTWKKEKSFQIYVNGLGSYSLSLQAKREACDKDNFKPATVEIGRSKVRKVLSECLRGVVRSKPVLVAEERVKQGTIKHTRSHNTRFMVGGLLLTINNGDTKPRAVSLTNKNATAFVETRHSKKLKNVEISENWPFHLRVISKTNQVIIGNAVELTKLEQDGGSATIRKVSPYNNYIDIKKLSKVRYGYEQTSSDRFRYKTLGPLFCWQLPETDSACYEINEAFLGLKENPAVQVTPVAKDLATNFNRQSAQACGGNIVFDTNLYVTETVVLPKTCRVSFQAGASLEFGAGASMVILGPASFPETGAVYFAGRDSVSWGGVVFRGQSSLRVRNVNMKDSTEFTWNDRYFTGALNILDVKESIVENSVFRNTNSDDAVNIRGGVGKVIGNFFERNRDGLDMDLGTGEVSGNIFLDQLDDGIDLGTAGPILIRNNLIIGSGDKGISVGEESKVVVENNIIVKNNIGLANKDGSTAQLSSNYFNENNIGVSVYKKSQAANDVIPVEGVSYFGKNSVDYKLEGETASLKDLQQTGSSDREETVLLESIISTFDCESCTTFIGTVRDRL